MPAVEPQVAIIVVVIGILGLLPAAYYISAIFKNQRRNPPLDQELYRDFVRRNELDLLRSQFCDQVRSLDDRHQKTAGEIFDVLRSLKHDIGTQSTHIETSLNSVARELGKLDGRLQGHIEAEKK